MMNNSKLDYSLQGSSLLVNTPIISKCSIDKKNILLKVSPINKVVVYNNNVKEKIIILDPQHDECKKIKESKSTSPIISKAFKNKFQNVKQESKLPKSKVKKNIKLPTTTSKPSESSKNIGFATKYQFGTTTILMNWIVTNIHHPYPNEKEMDELVLKTGLNHNQVCNWITNVRKRNIKATIEGKKPHHYIDFLALITNREKLQKQQQQQKNHNESK